MWEIINTWGTKDKKLSNYIFPILSAEMTAVEQHFAVKSFNQTMNYWNRKIFEKLGIENKIGAMQARHSCATRLKHAGASTEFIQEILGHADKRTTENYLNSFENEVKKEYAGKLAPFKLKSVSSTG